MKKPLKQVVQEHIETISLNEQQLDKLMQIQHANDNNQRSFYKPNRLLANKPWYVALAAMVMVFVLGAVVVMQYSQTMPADRLIREIANEAAGNHLAMKPLEIQAVTINDVQSYFTKLDFLPHPSKLIEGNNKILLTGGRYCSIQGSIAAQLRYTDQQGGFITLFITLFEAHYSPEMITQFPNVDKGEKPIVTYAKGIKVTLWQELGLLMVSTEKPE